jgi:S-adenosylmethionine:tRNA ribosyltransferase-isomerase
MLDVEDYNFNLPQELVAQAPAARRDHSRLFGVDRSTGSFSDHRFFDLPPLLAPGDLLVVNNTQVVPARLFGHKASGGRVEILVLEHPESSSESVNETCSERLCLVKASGRLRPGSLLFFDADVSGKVKSVLGNGLITISFNGGRGIDPLIEEKGCLPLPPYIKRGKDSDLEGFDRDRYQTVYAARKGAVAAPTAGLHFTRDLLCRLQKGGVSVVPLTLHVGYGTFRPVKVRDIREHRLGYEPYAIAPETAGKIRSVRESGGRIIAVGTTVVRALESAAAPDGSVIPGEGKTNLLITPGFVFRIVDGLITNFHLPKSSLLFLVSAFAGLDLIKRAYAQAIEKRYRFYSYGDAMLIL